MEEHVKRACDIAAGRIEAPAGTVARRPVCASKDYSARGSRRHHWYRMVYRGASWQYAAKDYLPRGNFLASDRCATVRGDLYEGEITITHDHGGRVDVGDTAASLVVAVQLDADGKKNQWYVDCAVRRARGGRLIVTLPDGTEIDTPDPRA